MPAFLVELPASGGKTLIGAADSLVVFAANATDARAMAANAFDGDSNVLWNDAITTVTEIVAGTAMPTGFEFEVEVIGNTNPFRVQARGGAGNLALAGGVVGSAAGLSYVDNEIVTIVGGTFTRAATFRCEGTGAVTAVALEDPGEYTILPTLDEMVTSTSGGGDDNLTIDGVAALENSYEVMLGQMVTILNAQTDIANAEVEMSELLLGPRLFTIASIADNIGDSTVSVRFGTPHSGNVPGLTSTIVDGGIAGAVLTMAIPAIASLVIPTMLRALKS